MGGMAARYNIARYQAGQIESPGVEAMYETPEASLPAAIQLYQAEQDLLVRADLKAFIEWSADYLDSRSFSTASLQRLQAMMALKDFFDIDIGPLSFLQYVSFRQGHNSGTLGKEVGCLKKKKSVKKIAEIEYNEFPPEEDNILDDFCTVASTTECTGFNAQFTADPCGRGILHENLYHSRAVAPPDNGG